jgi:Flp pilus assembly protein TadD
MSGVLWAAARCAAILSLGATLAGCMTNKDDVTGSIQPTSASREIDTSGAAEARWRALAAKYGPAYEKNPNDPATAYAYGVTLRALGQRAQALAVLEAASLKNPGQKQILGAYGRALADAGRYDEALSMLNKAHTPDAPDWRILNAQGAILDQLGRAPEARAHYESALKIAPGEPSILSNLGLSYALSKDLAKAEATLAQAALSPKADEKVRANLAMVQRLKASAPTGKNSG